MEFIFESVLDLWSSVPGSIVLGLVFASTLNVGILGVISGDKTVRKKPRSCPR